MVTQRIRWSRQAILSNFSGFCDRQTTKTVSALTQKYRDRLTSMIAKEVRNV